MNNKKKKTFGLIALLLAAAGYYWWKNPNNKPWKESGTSPIDMATHPLKWSLFNNTVTAAYDASLTGKISGNKIVWNQGSVWTY